MKRRYSTLIVLAIIAAVLSAVMFGCAKAESMDQSETMSANGYKDYDMAATTTTAAATMIQTTMRAESSGMIKDDFYTGAVPQATQLVSSESKPEPTERKLIRNANYSMETLKYDETVSAVKTLIEKLGGYIQSETSYGEGAIKSNYYVARNSNYIIRLPAEKFNDFYNEISLLGSITNNHTYVDDVSSYYYDTEARLNTMHIREERLLEILQKATKLEDIIMLEQELQDVRYEIENLQGTLNRVDDQVAYSTINLNINEVFEYTDIKPQPRTFWERLSDRFSRTIDDVKDGFEDFALFILGDSIMIIIWVAILAGIFFIIRYLIRRAVRKHRERRAARKDEEETKSE